MKNIGIFAVLLAACLLLAGCKGAENSADVDATISVETQAPLTTWDRAGVTLELPENFNDCSDLPFGQQYEFLYSGSMLGIYGTKESKDTASEGITDLASYSAHQAAAMNAEANTINGISTITYEIDTQDDPQTYVCAFYETETDYWTITSYCPSRMYEFYQETMLSYVTAATIQ